MQRSEALQDLLDGMLKSIGGVSHEESKTMGICVFCKAEIKMGDFRDDLSIKEFNISRMCQSCQDKVFSPMEDEEY